MSEAEPEDNLAPPADQGLLDAAVAMAVEAGQHTLRWFNTTDLGVDWKGDGTPVTEADLSAELMIRERIAAQYPDDAILGEEHADVEGTTGRQWMIDPIDGTKSFTHGVPLFSNLIAVADENGPAVGVINLPALDEIVYAGRGLGCFHKVGDREPVAARVSNVARVDRAAITASGFEGFPADVLARWTSSGAIVRTWGDAYGYALVATGRVEAMFDYGLSAWDIAPMLVIIPEAGGTVTAWDGSPEPMGGNTISTNGTLHAELSKLVT